MAAHCAAAAASARLFQRLEKATAAIYIYYYTASRMEVVGSKSATQFFPHLSKILQEYLCLDIQA